MITDNAELVVMCRIADGASSIKVGGSADDCVKIVFEVSGLEAGPDTLAGLMLLRERLLKMTLQAVE